jgi:hypothetical protein
MTQERYKQIRQMPNFLHLYFVEEIGQGVAQQQFDHLFNTWLMSVVGIHPVQGIEKIKEYLDKQLRN